jgi:elongation factor G
MEFPEPVIEIAIEPKTKADQEKMASRCRWRRGSVVPRVDRSGSGQTISRAWANCISTSRSTSLKRTHKVDANVGAPQVAYRETITKPDDIDYTHKKQTGGSGQFARVKIVVRAERAGARASSSNPRSSAARAEGIHPRRREGHEVGAGSGVLAGFPVVDLKVTLIDGAYHDVDSSCIAFEIASRAALREALQKGGPKLLEPIMKVEVVTPEDYVGDVSSATSIRGAARSRAGHARQRHVVNAMVPLANMFGYVNTLRSMSRGARSTPCSSITTRRCRRRSPRRSRRSTPA